MHKSIALAAMALFIATPAPAQLPPAPALKSAPTRAPGQASTVQPRVSQSPYPTVDEGTIARIAAAMLSYSALEVQGGWPMLPPSSKLVPGASGPDVALLRRRLAMTDDLPAELAGGDVYDD